MINYYLLDENNKKITKTAFYYNELNLNKLNTNRKKYKKYNSYVYDMIFTFDIETTSVKCEKPYGFMYIWQVCIDGVVYYGRTWKEFFMFLDKIIKYLNINIKNRLFIFVHNLSYEFQFIKDFLVKKYGIRNIVTNGKRKIICCTTENGIEFRCTYKLTNMSLEKACKNEIGVKYKKLNGDLDYSLFRTPNTPLTEKEYSYCFSDVYILYEFIKNRLKNDNETFLTLPLTSTGYIRRHIKNKVLLDKNYTDLMNKTKLTKDVYELLYKSARGGNTHANRFLSNQIIEGKIESYDVCSSYPFQIITKKYPCDNFKNIGKPTSISNFYKMIYNDNTAQLFKVLLKNVKIKKEVTIPYISKGNCIEFSTTNSIFDNGRILKCDFVCLCLTDIDFKIIKEQYTYTDIFVGDIYQSDYNYLPRVLTDEVIKLFYDKSLLKYKINNNLGNTQELQYLYMRKKALLNSVFGMMFTNPIYTDYTLDNNNQWKEITKSVQSSLNEYNKEGKKFINYSWGVWTTAHAREHLQTLLNIVGKNNIYCDTDSSKFIYDEDIINKINKENEKIIKLCEDRKAFCDVNNERYYMGIYEKEKPYKKFKTLGAKKYVYVDFDDELYTTISGVKKEGKKELKTIDNFNIGFKFTLSAGQTAYYNDDEIKIIELNNEKILTSSNIALLPTTYTIGISNDYAELLGISLEELEML